MSHKKKATYVEPKLLSVYECAMISGMSTWWWRRAAYTGRIASAKISNRLLIPKNEVKRILAESLRPRAETPLNCT